MTSRLPILDSDDRIPQQHLPPHLTEDGLSETFERGLSFTDSAIGGVGDGATDNTAAWNAAMTEMAARGGGTLFFPAGVYLINGATDAVPGGVWLVGEGFDYHTPLNSADRPIKMSVIRAGAVMARLIQLGTNATVSTPGATGSSMFGLVVDGAGLAAVAVKTAARRNKIIQCQVGYATSIGLQMSGQNGKIDHCVVDQANVGDCLVIDRYPDNKVKHSDVRQPGTTGACVRVVNGGSGANVDMADITGNHMWTGQNGIPTAGQGLVVVEGAVSGAHITNNTLETINGPEVYLKANTGAIQDVLIAGNKFYTLATAIDNTYSNILIEGGNNVQNINIVGNTAAGVDSTHRFKSFIQFSSTLPLFSNRILVTGNVLRNVATWQSGSTPPNPVIWGDNVNHTGAAQTHSRNKGRSTHSGTGAQTAFTIAHGLGGVPTSVRVTPGSSAAAGAHFATADATNITVTYTAAPASGSSNNVILNWQADL